jgi:hypothetical protein
MTLATRLRAIGVSEERLYAVQLAQRARHLPERASDEEIALASEYLALKRSQPFEAAKLREMHAAKIEAGSNSIRAIDQWLEEKQIVAKHHFKAEK